MPREKLEKIAEDYNVALFPIFMLIEGFYDAKEIIGKPCYLFLKLENNFLIYYRLSKNWETVHNLLVKKIKQSPKFLRMILNKMEELGYRQIKYTQKIKKNLKNKNNKELNNYYQKYIKYNIELYSYGPILSLLEFQDTTFLSDEVNKILKTKKAEKYFEILTTPLKSTFNKLQEVDLLKILVEIKKDKVLLNYFKKLKNKNLIQKLEDRYPKIWSLITKHTKKYSWVHYVYKGPAADEIYFIQIIQDFIKDQVNPVKEINNFIKEKKELKSEQEEILKRINFNNYEKQIIKLARDSVVYKAYRRELQSWSFCNMEAVLQEIANRLYLSLEQIRMMLPNEIERALLKDEININLINKRIDIVVYGMRNNKKFCLAGQRAREFVKKNIKKEKKINKNIKKIQGTPAFQGLIKGKVKIVNSPDDISKMEDNNILVSFATSPNLMPAIRKASAIITNEGGLTCHAAIVSRELKIPCVIGTKIATKVLKDGDLVEVDANKGVVKKLNR